MGHPGEQKNGSRRNYARSGKQPGTHPSPGEPDRFDRPDLRLRHDGQGGFGIEVEDRLVAAQRQFDAHPRVEARGVGLSQPLAHLASGHAHDGCALGVEIVASFENVDGDVAFLNGSPAAGQRLLDNVTQKGLPAGASVERRAFQKLVQVSQNAGALLFRPRKGTVNDVHSADPPFWVSI